MARPRARCRLSADGSARQLRGVRGDEPLLPSVPASDAGPQETLAGAAERQQVRLRVRRVRDRGRGEDGQQPHRFLSYGLAEAPAGLGPRSCGRPASDRWVEDLTGHWNCTRQVAFSIALRELSDSRRPRIYRNPAFGPFRSPRRARRPRGVFLAVSWSPKRVRGRTIVQAPDLPPGLDFAEMAHPHGISSRLNYARNGRGWRLAAGQAHSPELQPDLILDYIKCPISRAPRRQSTSSDPARRGAARTVRRD